MRLLSFLLVLFISATAFADRTMVYRRDGSLVVGTLESESYPYFVDVRTRSGTVRVPGSNIRRIEYGNETVEFPEHIEEPTLRVPLLLMLSSVVLVGVGFGLLYADPSVNAADCDDGCFGGPGIAAFTMWGIAGATFIGALTTSLPRRLRVRAAWREMRRLHVGVSASRRSGTASLQVRF